jgi:anti-sigma factor RsiW
MRGQITDQDLTNYALNELQPEERFYVESMLAVREDCRNDVYEMIELSQMLEEGFEVQEEATSPYTLTAEQRQALMDVRVAPRWIPQTAAVLAAAACAAFAITHPNLWRMDGPAAGVAQLMTNQVKTAVTDAVNTTVASVSAPDLADVDTQIGTFRKLAEDPALKKWFSTDWLSPEFSSPEGPWAQPPAVWDPMPQVLLEMP